MKNRKALKCTLGVVVAALFLAVTWSTTAARFSAWTTKSSAVKPNAIATAPKKLMSVSALMQSTATVATNRSSYTPGSTVKVTGTGWLPGETVTLSFAENPRIDGPHVLTTVADGRGRISDSDFVVDLFDGGVMFTLTATGGSSNQTATTMFKDDNPHDPPCGGDGTGVVTVTANGGSCLAFTPASGNGPDNWEVAGGGSYTMTISGVTECAGDTITVFIQHTEFPGNFCLNATGTPGSGVYSVTFTIPDCACNTYPISYKCGANQSCDNSCTFNAKGPSGNAVHLRAATFDSNCNLQGTDTDCTCGGGGQGCTIGEPPPGGDLGCNPATIPGDEQIVNGTCDGVPGQAEYSVSNTNTGCTFTRVNTWTITCGEDICTVSQTVTWKEDTTPPVLANVPTGGDLGCNPETLPSCSTAVTATDDCDGDVTASVTCTPGSITDVGTCGKSQTFTYSAADACGNPVSQDVTYTWKEDTTPPVLANVPTGGDLGCNPTLPTCSTAVTATDNCDTTVTVQCSAGEVTGPDCAKSQTFTYSADDACGNHVSQDVTYTWKVDTTPPVLANVPTGGSLGCNPTPPTCSTSVTATDNCDTTVTVHCSAGDVTGPDCAKSQTFTYSADDACGNHVSQDVTYTWKVDHTPPVLAHVPTGGNLGCNPTPPSCSSAVTATDNCDGSVPVTCTPASIMSAGCQRSQMFTYSASDSCGNEVSQVVAYTWTVDTTPPVITCPSDKFYTSCDTCPTDPAVTGQATATDNCDTDVSITYRDAVTGTCPKVTVRTWTATDDCGNHASCTQTITCLPPGAVTNTERCSFDVDPSTPCKDFNLIFTQDPQNMPAYKLTASNPGQFFYNVFYTGTPGSQASFDVTLPYPFETQGANPVHAYSTVGVNINSDGSYCLTPGQEVYVGSQQVYVNCGAVSNPSGVSPGTISGTIPISLTVPSSGFLFIAIHVDYGLKGCSGYNKDSFSNAVDFATGLQLLIPNLGHYQFGVSGSQNDSSEICNINNFKKNPGVGGLSLNLNTDPVPGSSITLKNPNGQTVGSATTDRDGWYQITYKHTGKSAIYTVTIVKGSFRQTKNVELKANAYFQVDFTVP